MGILILAIVQHNVRKRKMKLEQVTGEDRDLLVTALQSLHRERIAAFSSACTACELSGRKCPDSADFGIQEVTTALRRVGAHPIS